MSQLRTFVVQVYTIAVFTCTLPIFGIVQALCRIMPVRLEDVKGLNAKCKTLSLLHRTFNTINSVHVKKLLYLSLIRSQLTYCSITWRPYLHKDILMLEKIQRRATKFILNDYSSDYKSRLVSLQLLSLMMLFELNDIIFFVKSLNCITSSFNILS